MTGLLHLRKSRYQVGISLGSNQVDRRAHFRSVLVKHPGPPPPVAGLAIIIGPEHYPSGRRRRALVCAESGRCKGEQSKKGESSKEVFFYG